MIKYMLITCFKFYINHLFFNLLLQNGLGHDIMNPYPFFPAAAARHDRGSPISGKRSFHYEENHQHPALAGVLPDAVSLRGVGGRSGPGRRQNSPLQFRF